MNTRKGIIEVQQGRITQALGIVIKNCQLIIVRLLRNGQKVIRFSMIWGVSIDDSQGDMICESILIGE